MSFFGGFCLQLHYSLVHVPWDPDKNYIIARKGMAAEESENVLNEGVSGIYGS